jgi:hypothetical protein
LMEKSKQFTVTNGLYLMRRLINKRLMDSC